MPRAVAVFRQNILLFLAIANIWMLGGCAWLMSPPAEIDNACRIFEQRSSWYRAAKASEKKWQTPVALTMAFMHQESSFRNNARPPRRKLFGFIPWTRESSSYGYAQATTETWEDYKNETGRRVAFRSNFSDVADFIGWYNKKSVNILKLRHNDAYNLYLAYHEGWGGYRRRSYTHKKWLKKVARKVQKNFITYRGQINKCRDKIDQPWYKRIF